MEAGEKSAELWFNSTDRGELETGLRGLKLAAKISAWYKSDFPCPIENETVDSAIRSLERRIGEMTANTDTVAQL